jgi:hypothetical protein
MDRNFLVQNGRITDILDWEWAGFYPERWEFVQLMVECGQRVIKEFPDYDNVYLLQTSLKLFLLCNSIDSALRVGF